MKKVIITSGGVLAVWLTFGLTVGTAQDQAVQSETSQFEARHSGFDRDGSAEWDRIRRGFRISPVDLNLRGKDPELVGLGSYIVNTGGCNDCHTNPSYAPGGDRFFMGEKEVINAEGYLGGGTPFGPPGGLVSANLTPDAWGRPAGLTFAEFRSLMRTGIDPDDGHILQVMPWNVFGKKTNRELRAIYEYLRAIPHIPRSVDK